MDIIQAVLDGIAIAAIFNGTVAALVLINPRFFFDSYPKAIQKAAPEQMTKQEKTINGILTVVIVGICFAYSIVSLLHTGIAGFWNVNSGHIYIGNADLSQMPLSQNMDLVTYVSQENFLFRKSILENMRFAKADATLEEVQEACRKAR